MSKTLWSIGTYLGFVIVINSALSGDRQAGAKAFLQSDGVSNDTSSKEVVSDASIVKEEREPAPPWENFEKPSNAVLRHRMTAMQYKVTQQKGTEPAFQNAYWKNHRAGIYVDMVSGEPLFSSSDKFESGTGWPSFVKPLDSQFIVYRADNGFFTRKTEVRSKLADSHLGHVFDDGPTDRGGKRFCMNSAALRFIPKARMEAEGYGTFLPDVNDTATGPRSDFTHDGS